MVNKLFLIIALLLLFPNIVSAQGTPCPTSCILGEARGEGYKGMVAVSEAIRNRGTLEGVYGCKAKFDEPKWVWDMAKKAWEESSLTDLVKGATHWESTDFKEPYWAKDMIVMAHIGKHKFYKELK